jgi:hypothetical protein
MAAAAATTMQMERICVARSSRFKLPYLDFRGSPVGVDIRKVVEHQISPSITTGILHATAGTGQIGAGVVRAPLACFEDALLTFDAALR